jgi:hypothetical protein
MPFPGFSLSEAVWLYVRSFEKYSRNLALDFAQCRALLVLAENERVTQRRLSELTAIPRGSSASLIGWKPWDLQSGTLAAPIAGRGLLRLPRTPGPCSILRQRVVS